MAAEGLYIDSVQLQELDTLFILNLLLEEYRFLLNLIIYIAFLIPLYLVGLLRIFVESDPAA